MSADRLTTAVVILNYNGEHWLKQFLPSVIENSSDEGVNIYVADNESTDGSIELLKKDFPKINIIETGGNYGYAGGYNRALKSLKEDVFVLLNSDVEVTPNWITPILSKMANDESIAACQPKILCYDNKNSFEYAGANGGYIDIFGYPFCRGRLFDTLEVDEGQYNSEERIFWASGACLFVRASAFRQAGELDADFFAHMEEIDLCWRLNNLGYKVIVEPNSMVYHVGGGTLPKGNPHKIFLNFRNNLVMMTKNLPKRGLLFIIPIRLVLDGIAGIQMLLSGKPQSTLAIIKAHISYYLHIFSTLGKRKSIPNKAFRSMNGVFTGSIVWSYFALGKRKFSEIFK